MTSVFVKEEKGRRCEEEKAMWKLTQGLDWEPQAKECQDPPDDERGKEQDLPKAAGGSPALLTLDFGLLASIIVRK